MTNQILIIVGAFMSILLSVIAYLLKELLKDMADLLKNLNEFKLVVTTLKTEHAIYTRLVDVNAKEIKGIRDRLHSVEGSNGQLLQYIEKYIEKI